MSSILLVEDDQSIRELYERQLKKAGFAVDTAENGKKGSELALTGRYDLILLDVMMPVMNGLDTLKEMRKNGVKIPAVFLTNLGQESVVNEGIKLGALGYLIKASYTPNELIAEINKILIRIKSVN